MIYSFDRNKREGASAASSPPLHYPSLLTFVPFPLVQRLNLVFSPGYTCTLYVLKVSLSAWEWCPHYDIEHLIKVSGELCLYWWKYACSSFDLRCWTRAFKLPPTDLTHMDIAKCFHFNVSIPIQWLRWENAQCFFFLNNHRVSNSLHWEQEKEIMRERELFHSKPVIASAWLSMEALMSH